MSPGTISPSWSNVEESQNTLKFASRVKKVVLKPESHEILDDKALIQKYRKEIKELKVQLKTTTEKLEMERQAEISQLKAERLKVFITLCCYFELI